MIEKPRVLFSLRQLGYFVAAADTLSITEAARHLNISQPAVSTAVSGLEEIFQTQLFIRHHALGLALTPAGHLLAREARALLNVAADVHSTMREFSDAGAGSVSAGFLVTLAPFLLPSLARGFQAAFPRAEFRPQEGSQTFLLKSLKEGFLDCVITYDLKVPDDLAFHPILRLPPLALLPQSHPLASQAKLTLADLAPEPMVQLDLPLSREYFETLFSSAGLVPRIGYKSAFTDVVHSMVAEGLGYTVWNFPLKNPQGSSGRPLVAREIDEPLMPLRLGIVTLAAGRKRNIVQAFIDFCERELQPLA